MEKVYVSLALAIFVSETLAMNLRHKRQSDGEGENKLDERYGWDRPREAQQWGNMNQPWQQNQWGNSGQNLNRPSPFPNQNGQNGGNWQNQNWPDWQNQNGQNGQNWQNQNGQNGQDWQNQNGQNGQNWQNQNGQNWQNQNGQNWQNQNGQNWQNQNGQNGQNWQNQNGQNGQNPQPTPRPNGSTTQSPEMMECISSCPVTPEYNPVCGSDGTTYSNPGRLGCAQSCGLNVSQDRASPCPTTTTTTTAAPQTTTQSFQMIACFASCPVTNDYGPVCGSDGVTYANPSSLSCAQSCGFSCQVALAMVTGQCNLAETSGLDVSLISASRCPTATSTTATLQ